jgi:hypothetical protein
MTAEGAREYFYGLLVAPTVSSPQVELKSAVASGDQVAIKANVTVDLSGTLGRVVTLRETGFSASTRGTGSSLSTSRS